jgi:hypothetical protein
MAHKTNGHHGSYCGTQTMNAPMCPISHFFISPFGNTQALMTIIYNNEDKFWSGKRYC